MMGGIGRRRLQQAGMELRSFIGNRFEIEAGQYAPTSCGWPAPTAIHLESLRPITSLVARPKFIPGQTAKSFFFLTSTPIHHDPITISDELPIHRSSFRIHCPGQCQELPSGGHRHEGPGLHEEQGPARRARGPRVPRMAMGPARGQEGEGRRGRRSLR